MMDECDVNIIIFFFREECDQVIIVGICFKVNKVIEVLQQKVVEIEVENEDWVGFFIFLLEYYGKDGKEKMGKKKRWERKKDGKKKNFLFLFDSDVFII